MGGGRGAPHGHGARAFQGEWPGGAAQDAEPGEAPEARARGWQPLQVHGAGRQNGQRLPLPLVTRGAAENLTKRDENAGDRRP